MKITKLPLQPKIDDDSIITIKDMGNVISVKYVEKANRKQTIQRLNKDEYIRLTDDTGEVLKINHNDSRADDKISLYKTFKTIRELVNTNCIIPENIRWITLTYKENMQDEKQLYKDFANFNKRFQRRYKAEYIAVAEPQKRGAWHMHLIYIFDHEAPYIPNKELSELWGHGFVNIQRVKNVDNLGAYLSAYLGNVPIEEMEVTEIFQKKYKVVESDVNGKSKKFVKGGRLPLYPAGMNIFRCSRGIRRPDIKKKQYKDIKGELSEYCKTYETAYKIENEEANFNSVVITEEYNKVRKKS